MIIEWIVQHSLDQYIVAALGGNVLTLYILVKVGRVIAKRTKTTVDDEVLDVIDEARSIVKGRKSDPRADPILMTEKH